MGEGGTIDPGELARTFLDALDEGRRLAPVSGERPDFDTAAAYRVTARLRALREARGERHLGRKLGFTNRRLWPEFGVDAPIWGDLFDTTCEILDAPAARVALAGLNEPKIEPEIALGLVRAPAPGMDEAALMGCVGWVAHGIEIVQSPFPGWRAGAADMIAAGAMHGRYLLGPRRMIGEAEREAWRAALGDFSAALLRDGTEVATGGAADVLGGPLAALGHLVDLLAADPANPPLAPGEFVTTGTLTPALDVAPGQRWEARLAGLDLPGLVVELA